MESARKRMKKAHNNYLPNEIIAQILASLPVKSILRFKCVSKQWGSTIIDQHFIDQHLSNQRKKEPQILFASYTANRSSWIDLGSKRVIITNSSNNYGDFKAVLKHDLRKTTIRNLPSDQYTRLYSCDGVCCLYGKETILLCNPNTREFRCFSVYGGGFFAHNFKGERTDYYHIVGIGRDAVTQEFKILRLFDWKLEGEGPPNEYEILTLGPEAEISWRKLNGIYNMLRVQRPIYTNGALYWLDIGLGVAKFIRFDLHTEEFQAIILPYPSQLSVNLRDLNSVALMSLRNSLCLVEKDIANSKLNVWSFIKDNMNYNSGGAWKELYSIPIDSGWKSCLSLHLCSITEHKDGIISVYYYKNGLLLYNPKSKSCKYYLKKAPKLKKFSTTHFESLVPLYGQKF